MADREIYREGLKNWEMEDGRSPPECDPQFFSMVGSPLDKEAPQIFWPAVGPPKTHRLWGAERGALLQAKTRSEDKKYEAKPTPTKTNFSITSGISTMLQILALIRSFTSPLLGLIFLILASGLFSTFSSLRLEAEGLGKDMIGLITSTIYGGILLGSLCLPRFIEKWGHTRSFIFFASTSALLVLALAFWFNPFYWAFLRFIGGICTAGIFIVIESWLLIQSPPKMRGAALSIYMGTVYGALSLGQFFINFADPMSIYPFCITAALCIASLFPISMQKNSAPKLEQKSHLSLIQLFRISPLGFLGGIISGMLLAIIYGLVPLYGKELGMEISEIGMLMAIIIFGGLSFQIPVSRWADKSNRRLALNTSCFCSTLLGSAIAFFETSSTSLLLPLAWLFGGFCFAIYPLSMAYTSEKLDDTQIVAATGGFVLSYATGAIIGPIIAPLAMNLIGNAGLFYLIAFLTFLLGLFGLKKPISVDFDPKS